MSLTKTQLNHFNKPQQANTGVQINLAPKAVEDMVKTGGIFPVLAAIPALIAVAVLGAVGTNAGMALKKATGI